jgi:hypothetical protein
VSSHRRTASCPYRRRQADDLPLVDDPNSAVPRMAYECTRWHTYGIGTAKRTAEAWKTAYQSQLEPYSPINVKTGNSREHAGISAKTLGLADGCSRLFSAIPGTGDRKRTAGEVLRSFFAVGSEPLTPIRARVICRLPRNRAECEAGDRSPGSSTGGPGSSVPADLGGGKSIAPDLQHHPRPHGPG